MATNANAAPFGITLRGLPLPVRLTLSLFLIAVGLGYFAGLMQLHFRDASKGEPLPTPNDVVEIFSGVENWPIQKPAPPPPMCKMEKLIMGPEDESPTDGKSMAKPFFTLDKKTAAKADQDPAYKAKVHQEREGERLAVQAWIHLPDDQRNAAYENDELTLPDSLANHPISKPFLDPNGKVRVNSIIQERCAKCHSDELQPGHKKLVDSADFADVLVVPPAGRTSRQMSLESLTQTTHLHLLSFCMLWMLTGVIFAFSSYWKWFRCIVAPLVLLAQVADVSCWWLARLPNIGPYFALVIIGTGTLVAVGLVLQIMLSLFDMYRWPGRMVLLVLLIGAVAGAALLAPPVRDYLKSEAAPPTSAGGARAGKVTTRVSVSRDAPAERSDDALRWRVAANRDPDSRRVEPAARPRVAAADAPDALARPTQRAVLVHRRDHVLAAARLEPAHRGQDRPQANLIKAHSADQKYLQNIAERGQDLSDHGRRPSCSGRGGATPTLRAACRTSRGSALFSSSNVGCSGRRGTSTRSRPTGISWRVRRNASR